MLSEINFNIINNLERVPSGEGGRVGGCSRGRVTKREGGSDWRAQAPSCVCLCVFLCVCVRHVLPKTNVFLTARHHVIPENKAIVFF